MVTARVLVVLCEIEKKHHTAKQNLPSLKQVLVAFSTSNTSLAYACVVVVVQVAPLTDTHGMLSLNNPQSSASGEQRFGRIRRVRPIIFQHNC